MLKNSIIVAIGLAIGSAIGIFLSSLQVTNGEIESRDKMGAIGVIGTARTVDHHSDN